MTNFNNTQTLITLIMLALGTVFTRFLPFAIFRDGKPIPPFIHKLQDLLPCAMVGLLVIYCLKDIRPMSWPNGLPELIAIGTITVLHLTVKNTLLSIAGGTAAYMLLIQFVFV